MFETNQGIVLLVVLWVVSLILWYLQHRSQKKLQLMLEISVQELEEDIIAQKELINIQMQDLTAQMTSHAALHEKLQEAEKKLLDFELGRISHKS